MDLFRNFSGFNDVSVGKLVIDAVKKIDNWLDDELKANPIVASHVGRNERVEVSGRGSEWETADGSVSGQYGVPAEAQVEEGQVTEGSGSGSEWETADGSASGQDDMSVEVQVGNGQVAEGCGSGNNWKTTVGSEIASGEADAPSYSQVNGEQCAEERGSGRGRARARRTWNETKNNDNTFIILTEEFVTTVPAKIVKRVEAIHNVTIDFPSDLPQCLSITGNTYAIEECAVMLHQIAAEKEEDARVKENSSKNCENCVFLKQALEELEDECMMIGGEKARLLEEYALLVKKNETRSGDKNLGFISAAEHLNGAYDSDICPDSWNRTLSEDDYMVTFENRGFNHPVVLEEVVQIPHIRTDDEQCEDSEDDVVQSFDVVDPENLN